MYAIPENPMSTSSRMTMDLGTWNKKYKNRGSSDKDHKCCIWKMADGHQKCVGKSILDGIVKFRKNRVDVQEDHQVNDQDHHK